MLSRKKNGLLLKVNKGKIFCLPRGLRGGHNSLAGVDGAA